MVGFIALTCLLPPMDLYFLLFTKYLIKRRNKRNVCVIELSPHRLVISAYWLSGTDVKGLDSQPSYRRGAFLDLTVRQSSWQICPRAG